MFISFQSDYEGNSGLYHFSQTMRAIDVYIISV